MNDKCEKDGFNYTEEVSNRWELADILKDEMTRDNVPETKRAQARPRFIDFKKWLDRHIKNPFILPYVF